MLILKSDERKMARTKISFGHKQLADGVIRSRRRNEARVFHAKNRVTCDLRPCGYPVGHLLELKKIIFFSLFFGFHKKHIIVGS